MGGLAALAVVVSVTPASIGGAGYITLMRSMAAIAAWIIGPSVLLTLVTGLLAIAVHAPFHDAGWAWAKAATGILIFEGGLHVMGPIQEEAKRGASLLVGHPAPASGATLLTAEADILWVLLAVSVANIVLGVWRPRFSNFQGSAAAETAPYDTRESPKGGAPGR